MTEAFICDAIRTPFGRYGGSLASVRADDLGAIALQALMQRNKRVDWNAVYGCANQAGEDNRNVGRMSLLLAGLPKEVPGTTVNRLCGSSMDAIAIAARAIKSGGTKLMIAGGVEIARTVFLESVGRYENMFARRPPITFAQFVERVPMIRGRLDSRATTATGYAWFVWDKRAGGDTRLVWAALPP